VTRRTGRIASESNYLKKSILTSLRRELVLNFLKHNLNSHKLDQDVNSVIGTFFEDTEEDDTAADLNSLISRDLGKLFQLLEGKQDKERTSVKKKKERSMDSPSRFPVELHQWTREHIKDQVAQLNKGLEDEEKHLLIRKQVEQIFKSYSEDGLRVP